MHGQKRFQNETCGRGFIFFLESGEKNIRFQTKRDTYGQCITPRILQSHLFLVSRRSNQTVLGSFRMGRLQTDECSISSPTGQAHQIAQLNEQPNDTGRKRNSKIQSVTMIYEEMIPIWHRSNYNLKLVDLRSAMMQHFDTVDWVKCYRYLDILLQGCKSSFSRPGLRHYSLSEKNLFSTLLPPFE